MQSRWNDAEAQQYVARFAAHGEDLALRVYTSRLLGGDADLVLHGGGNTSVKTTVRDRFGRGVAALCVKGSGSDLADVMPQGLPALRLDALRELRALESLADGDMVAALRSALLDPFARDPSVETLLHAFLPHKFVDHTHADAILALTDQPDGERHVRAALGADVAVLPWIMPGFPLAKAVAEVFEKQPRCRGIVLLKHGLFTFGDAARESYERTIVLVDAAERYLATKGAASPPMLQPSPGLLPAAERRALLLPALPMLRGLLAARSERASGTDQGLQTWFRVVAEARVDDDLAAFAAHRDARALCATGPVTPDHVIRTKSRYLFLTRAEVAQRDACMRAGAAFGDDYVRYFMGGRGSSAIPMRSPNPQVAVIEGCGLVAFGESRKAARIAADIAEHTLRVKARAQALGRYQALTEPELFAMEYWPLELKKLGLQERPVLGGQVAVVTGAAGAIGCATAAILLEHGACVCLVDIDGARLEAAMGRLDRVAYRPQAIAVTADLTDPRQVENAFVECVLAFGGVDIVVANAGIAHVSRLEDMDPQRFQQVLEVNTTGTMLVLKAAAKVLRAQGTGGSVIVQASKNAFAPGAGFGAYSASKAAALQLGRIAALEFAEFGVAVNMVNADAVFGDDEVPSQLWQQVGPERMQARGLDAAGLREFYRQRSLLQTTVLPRHVAEAVLFFASGRTPTTGAVLPVDGGLPEAFPR